VTRSHLIVLPGGSYLRHAPYEGEPIAEWVRSLGIDSSVFAYPVGQLYPAALDAVLAEVRRIRSTGVERVGVLGFSAGGHAAGLAALRQAGDADRIDLAILGYPVVSMLTNPHEKSLAAFLGDNASAELRAETSLELLVSRAAPPFFVWHTAEDASVPVGHSYLLGSALAAHSMPHELHVFATGPHALGLATEQPGASAWTTLCATWLRQQGWLA